MNKKIVTGITLTLLVIGMLPLTFNIQQVKAEPITWTVGDSGSFIWGTPQDSSLKSTPESFYTSVVDIIHPQPGQFAHYFLQQYISPPGIGWWNTSYNEYVQPHIINTTHRVEDPFENGTYWCTVDTTNRWVTDTDPDSWWNQTWYGDWIETNVTVGSVIDWWWANATIFGSETLYVVGRDVDCWVANASSEGSYSLLYYDKLSGLLVKSEDFVFGGELSWEYTLNATNIISEPRTWTVDDDGLADFSSIQEAINTASPGDIIFVHSGTYYENVVVNKTVSLIGENKNNTIVEGNATGTVVTVTANNVNITRFTVRNGWGEWRCGIALASVENTNIFENIIADNELGIGLGYSQNSRISDNYLTHNEGGILLVVSNYNIFRSNKMVENAGGFGVMGENLTDFINDIDSSNTIDGKPIYYWINKRNMTVPLDAGYVALVNCTLITVDGLTQTQGVQFIYTTNSTIKNSIVDLSFYYSSDNIILRNNLSHSGHGIYLLASSNNIISENNITANSMFGIILWGANNNNCITRNNIAGNGNGGIYIAFSSNNTVTENNIANNWNGIKFMGGTNNYVYHNNFINNTNHASTDSINTWDNGFEGNYWSDYEEKYPDAQELNGSGIWDTPYDIDWNNQDNFPLMEPWSPTPPSPVEATQELIETVETWNLHKGTENSLKAKLKVAIHMLDLGKEDGAIRKLTAFINRAEILREKTLTNEQADYLIAEAQRIIDLING